MAVTLLASDVAIVEEDPQFSALPSIPTAILGGVGVTERGPFTATLANSFPEWTSYYGGLTAEADLTMAAMGFFLNGGETLWGARVVHIDDHTATPLVRTSAAATADISTTTGAATPGSVTSSVGPFDLDPGDDLDIKIDAGGTQTATFDAAAAAVTGSGGTYPTGWTGVETLIVRVDDGPEQTISFSAASLTLAQVIDEANPQVEGAYFDDNTGELRFTSDTKGTNSRVRVTGGTGLTELGFAGTEDVQDSSSDVADINAVTASEVEAVVEADTTAEVVVNANGSFTLQSPDAGATKSIQVEASSTADAKMGLDNDVHSGTDDGTQTMGRVNAKYDGAYGDDLDAVIADASSGDSDQFNLQIQESGVVLEVFPNLSTVLSDERYWETYINSNITGSTLVEAEDLLVGTPPANRPTNGTYSLSGGDNGLTSLSDNDFIGASVHKTGMYALDDVENLSMLIVPGRATSAVHQAMLSYCETWRERQVFAILDPPAGLDATEIVTYVKTTAALQQFSEHGAIYWPRIKILNPNATVFTSDADGNITVPPSGWIAGVYARTDASQEGGVYQPPAGVERGILYGVLGFETDEVLDKRKRDIVYPELINPLTTWEGAPRHIDGTRTLKSTGNFPTIAERRGVSFIERTVKLGLAFARHANNTRALRRRCHRTVYLFLLGEMQKGAFASDDPALAFSVDFSDKLNKPNVVRSGRLLGKLGLATNTPIDWVIISVAQDTRAIDEQLSELQAGR
jgi:hypothetical protein